MMNSPSLKNVHSFHIPVMGTGFTIDTPLRVAKYGISSVISLVDDTLIEQMRKYYCQKYGLHYEEIRNSDKDIRATRITAYLDLLDMLILKQVKTLKALPFEPGNEITRYFELLPDSSLKQMYHEMLLISEPLEKAKAQDILRARIVQGSIDVNIMTKLDRDLYRRGEKQPAEFSDAMAALRGYAQSKLKSSIVFSAGMNGRLFGYLAKFKDFFPDFNGEFKKKITLKVSDFRSALIQGKYLAKKGLWVSEYRIESGLNCGGHAFATNGNLLGPIIDDFKRKKAELGNCIHELYNKALTAMNLEPALSPHEIRVTVQGGIGTAIEDKFLMEHYDVDGTGWGTPFLMVPEVTNVGDAHLKKLSAAAEKDVYLSDSSPLGVPFWNLRNSASEEARRQRIALNKPGSPCPKGHLVSDTEFSKVPVCRASRLFQKRKLEQLSESDTPVNELQAKTEKVVVKSCICHDLGGGAALKYGIDPDAKMAVCCGPNIVNFSEISSLEEMAGHIYGRISLLNNTDRPHMFISELKLYVDHLQKELQKKSEDLLGRTAKRFLEFKQNLISGIEYYRDLAEQFGYEQRERFLHDLDKLLAEIESILPETPAAVLLEKA